MDFSNAYQRLFYGNIFEVVDEFCALMVVLMGLWLVVMGIRCGVHITSFRGTLRILSKERAHLSRGDFSGSLRGLKGLAGERGANFFAGLVLRLHELLTGKEGASHKTIYRKLLHNIRLEAHDHFARDNKGTLAMCLATGSFILALETIKIIYGHPVLTAAVVGVMMFFSYVLYLVRESSCNRAIDEINRLESIMKPQGV